MSKTILAQQEHSLTADTKLVVSHGTWRKKDYVDVRVHWRSPEDKWFPTKKGVRLGPDLARQLTDNIREMLGETPANGNGESAPVDISVPDAPAHRNGATPDLGVLAVLGGVAEHIHVGGVLEGAAWGRAVKDFSFKMAQHFQRPDAPCTAIFSPLMREPIEAEIARVRSAKKPRRAPQRPQAGVICWDNVSVATSQHPDHPQGASYCDKCQPYDLERIQAIAGRAQECVDGEVNRGPLPEEVFAWRRDLDATDAEQYERAVEKQNNKYAA